MFEGQKTQSESEKSRTNWRQFFFFFFLDARGRTDGIAGLWDEELEKSHALWKKNMWGQKAKEFLNSKQKYNHWTSHQ